MRIITLAAVAAAIAGPAFAAAPWTAVPAHSSSMNGFMGDSVVWSCDASGCSSQSDTQSANSMSECRALVRQLGVLTSFADSKGAYDATRLGRCNGKS